MPRAMSKIFVELQNVDTGTSVTPVIALLRELSGYMELTDTALIDQYKGAPFLHDAIMNYTKNNILAICRELPPKLVYTILSFEEKFGGLYPDPDAGATSSFLTVSDTYKLITLKDVINRRQYKAKSTAEQQSLTTQEQSLTTQEIDVTEIRKAIGRKNIEYIRGLLRQGKCLNSTQMQTLLSFDEAEEALQSSRVGHKVGASGGGSTRTTATPTPCQSTASLSGATSEGRSKLELKWSGGTGHKPCSTASAEAKRPKTKEIQSRSEEAFQKHVTRRRHGCGHRKAP